MATIVCKSWKIMKVQIKKLLLKMVVKSCLKALRAALEQLSISLVKLPKEKQQIKAVDFYILIMYRKLLSVFLSGFLSWEGLQNHYDGNFEILSKNHF